MEFFCTWFLEKPQRLISVGRSLCMLGIVLLLAGLLGYVLTTTISSIFSLAANAQSQPVKTLAEMYPSLPTWWIPESVPSFIFAIMLMAVGVAIVFAGEKYERILNGSRYL